MGNQRYRNYQQFKTEILKQNMGNLSSSVEDIADDMYRQVVNEEFDSMWDKVDGDDD